MEHLRRNTSAHQGISGTILAAFAGLRPSELRRCPAIFATVMAGLMTGLIGLGDLIEGGAKAASGLELSASFWLIALAANFIAALMADTGHDGDDGNEP